ncbi:MAG: hypothetical protein K5989_00665 [Lachnospiraceae bacterium]|nr:hypothetical protein [Lachnospiraceae bacterium]
MAMKEAATIDEFIDYAYNISKKMEEFANQNNADEKLVKLLTSASDPESRFKARILIQMMDIVDRVKKVGYYLHEPVKMEGLLQQKLDGSVRINNIPIPEGTIIEYKVNGEWEMGRISVNSQTKMARITAVNDFGTAKIERIEQLPVRIRQISSK